MAPGGIGRAGWNLAVVERGGGFGSCREDRAGLGQRARQPEALVGSSASAHICLVPTGPQAPGLLLPVVSSPLHELVSPAAAQEGSPRRGSPASAPLGWMTEPCCEGLPGPEGGTLCHSVLLGAPRTDFLPSLTHLPWVRALPQIPLPIPETAGEGGGVSIGAGPGASRARLMWNVPALWTGRCVLCLQQQASLRAQQWGGVAADSEAPVFSLETWPPGPAVFGRQFRVMPHPAQFSGAEPARDNLGSVTCPALAGALPV